MSEKDLLNFTKNDLATIKDTQYMAAETALLNVLRRSKLKTTYQHNKSNIYYALR